MSTKQLNTLLEKASHFDKDERYMATNDMCAELQKDLKIDENMESRICTAILKQLDDPSNDVQSVAVKCLGILLKKVQLGQVMEISSKLSSLMVEGRAELLDIYSIGLKTLIMDVPDAMGKEVSELLAGRLQNGISRQDSSDDVKRECLDNLADLLQRFGHLIPNEHRAIMLTSARHLEARRPVIRKRAGNCLGSLAVVAQDDLLNDVMEMLLSKIEGKADSDSPVANAETRTVVQTVGTISRVVGHRLSGHLERLVPLFVQICGDPDDENTQDDAANELRECCLPGLESIITRCPYELTDNLDSILDLCVSFVKYDPNYAYDDDDGDMDVDNDDEDEDDMMSEEEDYGDGSDDDDTSWKVRKGTVKVLSALLVARPDQHERFFDRVAAVLLPRFKEREANVRLDVIDAFTTLLAPGGAGHPSLPTAKVLTHLPTLVRSCTKLIKTSDAKSKGAIFTLLRCLVDMLDGELAPYMAALTQCIVDCAKDKKQNQSTKLDALHTLHMLLQKHKPSVVQPVLAQVMPSFIAAISDDWYKIVAEALRTIGELVGAMRPEVLAVSSGESMETEDCNENGVATLDDSFLSTCGNLDASLDAMYMGLLTRLEALDIDQEIKEGAIAAMGRLLHHFGDRLSDKVPQVLALLQQRLDNETTRTSALRAISAIAGSPLCIDVSAVVDELVVTVSVFLRQQSRVLKQATLECLHALVANAAGSTLSDKVVGSLLVESVGLIKDSDMILAASALNVVRATMARMPVASEAPVRDAVYPAVVRLAGSTLLQGTGEAAVSRFFLDLVARGYRGMGFQETAACLQVLGAEPKTTRVAVSNIARCLANMCLAASSHVAAAFRSDLITFFDQDTNHRLLALLAVGEMGHVSDVSDMTGLKDRLVGCFADSLEGVKTAAAFALGRCAVGSMDVFLPVVLSPSAPGVDNLQYLLLVALKEIIVVHASRTDTSSLLGYLDRILPQLLAQSLSDEEGVRSMVAECCGALVNICPDMLVPVLLNLVGNAASHNARWTALAAMRFALQRMEPTETAASPLDQALVTLLDTCLEEEPQAAAADGSTAEATPLSSGAIECRKAALLMLNTGLHFHPARMGSLLDQQDVLSKLYRTLDLYQKRVVDLGPFKHRVDDALPLRKAALVCIDTLLGTASLSAKLDVTLFMVRAQKLLGDNEEVKVQMYGVLRQLCTHSATAVANQLGQLVEPLQKTLQPKKPLPEGTGPEAERAWDVVKAACRLIVELNGVNTRMGMVCRPWSEFYDRVVKVDKIGPIISGFVRGS